MKRNSSKPGRSIRAVRVSDVGECGNGGCHDTENMYEVLLADGYERVLCWQHAMAFVDAPEARNE